MTTSDLERRLTAVLHQHAEDAMNRTHTEERLETLIVDAERDARRRWRAWVIGAAVAAAAAIVLIVGTPNLGSDRAETVSPAQPDGPQEVATAFLDAYGSFDRHRAASYLADGADLSVWQDARGVDDWRMGNRWIQAVGFRLLLDTCARESSSPAGTIVRCTFDFHALHSDELDRGPFSDNVFTFTIRDGRITEAAQSLAYQSNGFSTQMWEPFAAWVSGAHPEDAAVMYADWPETSFEALTDRSIDLWEQRSRDYVDSEKQNSATAS